MKYAARTAGVILTALVLQSAGAQGFDPATYPDFRQIVQEAKGKVFPAVIYIRCIRESNELGKRESQQVSGSGVIVSPEGHALTNWHVIDKALSVRVLLSDGRHADAKILGSDKDTDLAVIKLEHADGKLESLPYAALGDSTKLREGDFVMAMGAPWGLNRSVSIGIVSCTRRFLDQTSEYSLWLQTDAAINPGNSGGPLVNTTGEVVGLNARGMSGWAEGMGFAIPSETMKVIVPQLRDHAGVTWSWSGLQLQPLRDFNKDMYFDETEGVIVAETDPDSPARKAGVQARDRIVKVNGEPVTALTEEDLPTVRRRFGLLPKGEEAIFDVVRTGQPVSVKITPREKGRVEGEELALERWDFTIKSINQFDNPDLFFHRQKGVFVFGVKYPGNAQTAGLAHRDIILKVDGKEVNTPDEVKAIHKEAVANVATKPRIVLAVLRGGLMRQLVLDFSRDYQKE
jgi:serine protease Do